MECSNESRRFLPPIFECLLRSPTSSRHSRNGLSQFAVCRQSSPSVMWIVLAYIGSMTTVARERSSACRADRLRTACVKRSNGCVPGWFGQGLACAGSIAIPVHRRAIQHTKPRILQVSAPEQRLRPWCTTVAVCVLTATWWGFTALLARDVHPLSIQLTDACFALGLIAIFVSGWTIAFAWSPSSRRMVAFRAIATTLLLFILVLVLEVPAAVAIVDYSEVWSRLTGEWDGPTTSFINDWDVGFRHPPHSKWAGQPRSDMAVYWNLPIRRAAPMSFTTDARGFRNVVDRDSAEIALLGDSYIEGAYVSDDETCAAVAERKSGLQLTNLGLAGYGTLQELEVLIRYAVPL